MVSAVVTFSNERQARLMAQMNKVQAAETTHTNTNRFIFTKMEYMSKTEFQHIFNSTLSDDFKPPASTP